MSLSLTTTSMLASAGAGAAATAAVAAVLPNPSIFDVLVMGIPLGVLVAALGGSTAQYITRQSQPDRKVVRELLGTAMDGFIGGWSAMFLIGFKYSAPYFVAVEPAVIGALCALLVQFARAKGPAYCDRILGAFISWFSRGRVGGGS